MTEAQNPLTPSEVSIRVSSFNIPTPTRALAIGAHPDDIDFGCGGTLSKWAADGCEVSVLVCTDGSKGTWDPDADEIALIKIRKREQTEAARRLGATGQIRFLGQIDGELESTLVQRAAVARFIRETKPEVVLGHDPWKRYRLHPDHRHAGLLATEAIVAARDPKFFPDQGVAHHRPDLLLLFEADEPDHVEDITSTLSVKVDALLAHESQFESTMASGDDPDLAKFKARVAAKAARAAQAATASFNHIGLGVMRHAEIFKLIDDL